MKQSMRAKRMERNHKRHSQQAKLSLVSLMDIFTILVFFLMLNASDVQVLDNHKSITLPEATSEKPAKETLLLLVNNEDIVLQGQKLVSVEDVMAANDDTIEALAEELAYRISKLAPVEQVDGAAIGAEQADGSTDGRAITIMGDQSVPYALLKKIMLTCAQAGFTDVSLAVEQILSDSGDGSDGGAE